MGIYFYIKAKDEWGKDCILRIYLKHGDIEGSILEMSEKEMRKEIDIEKV